MVGEQLKEPEQERRAGLTLAPANPGGLSPAYCNSAPKVSNEETVAARTVSSSSRPASNYAEQLGETGGFLQNWNICCTANIPNDRSWVCQPGPGETGQNHRSRPPGHPAPLRPSPRPGEPLTGAQYRQLARWLREAGKRPGDLLLDPELAPQVPHAPEQLSALLARKLSLGLEDWSAAGLWPLARSDGDYPARWRRLLKDAAPP